MLIHWQFHQEYLYFLHETKVHLDSSQRTRLHLEFDPVRKKLCLLNLDPVVEYLSAFYSPIGRPAKNQVRIIRSFILMVMLGFTSLTAWLRKLKASCERLNNRVLNDYHLHDMGSHFKATPSINSFTAMLGTRMS